MKQPVVSSKFVLQNPSGFTLIELLAVIVIIGVLGAGGL